MSGSGPPNLQWGQPKTDTDTPENLSSSPGKNSLLTKNREGVFRRAIEHFTHRELLAILMRVFKFTEG